MQTEIWIKVTGKKKWNSWVAGPISLSKTKPSSGQGEVAIKVRLEIPDAVFEEPEYTALVVLPEPERDLPPRAVIADNVSKALSEKMGFKVHVDMLEDIEIDGGLG